MRQYLELFKLPGVKRLVVSALPGRFAYSMIQLATFFYVKDVTGSITLAGFATGLETLTSALTAGIRGSIIDRFGQFRPLSIFVPSWVLMVYLLTLNDDQTWILVTAALIGLASPPINLAARPLWRDAVGPANLRTAYAIDTTMMNATTVLGPVVATFLAIEFGGFAALWLTSATMAIGGFLMITMPLSRNRQLP
jgi:MFS family permease